MWAKIWCRGVNGSRKVFANKEVESQNQITYPLRVWFQTYLWRSAKVAQKLCESWGGQSKRPCPTNSCLTSSFHIHVLDEVSNSGVFVPVTLCHMNSLSFFAAPSGRLWNQTQRLSSGVQLNLPPESVVQKGCVFCVPKCYLVASQNHLKYVTLVDSLARVLENKPAHWKPLLTTFSVSAWQKAIVFRSEFTKVLFGCT